MESLVEKKKRKKKKKVVPPPDFCNSFSYCWSEQQKKKTFTKTLCWFFFSLPVGTSAKGCFDDSHRLTNKNENARLK